ncbi:hypothetical protein FG379_003570 [Cryptosporidium bovis]|uniref:uncharacterized protein n=1 Tax=Cryptosporidium bovis TaxID=310047 RepID=UPI00351A7A73|nr:hypothetical protein FG379_003570 [Cryptosporidium bovis]
MAILKLKRSKIKEKLFYLKKNWRTLRKHTKQNLIEKKHELGINKIISHELNEQIIDEYYETHKKSFEYDNNYLPLKEYMVIMNNKSTDYNNLLINDSIKKAYLSSNVSEDMKFYSMEYNNDEFMRENKFDDENRNLSNKNSFQNETYTNINGEYKKQQSNHLNRNFNKKNNSSISPNRSPYLFFYQQTPNHSGKKKRNEMSLDNINMENKEEYINSEELHMLFLKIRHLMKEKYSEYKELTNNNNRDWDEYGSKNGIRFFKKKEGSYCSKNGDKFTAIRGIIEVNLNKENDLLYNEFYNEKNSFSKNHHLSDLITSNEFVNYLWSTDPLTYDNTVDSSYRVHTWSDDNPGYCVYYHSYKGALGVQGRDFILFGYKNHSEIQSYGHLTKLTTSSSISSIYSPISTIKNNSSTTSPFSVSDINNNYTSDTGNSSNNRYMTLPIKSKRKFNKKNNNKDISNNSDSTKNNDEVIIDSSFFISSDLIMELSENNLYKLICEKNTTPSFIRGKCHLNGVKIDKLINKNNQKIVRMDIVWIGDLNGKLPEFIKKSLLSLSISTMKILKDKYIDLKKKELLEILESNN